MAESTWDDRERPILEAVRTAEEAGTNLTRAAHDCLPDLDERLHGEVLKSLLRASFLYGPAPYREGNGHEIILISGLTEKGRRAIGQWPSTDPAEAFLAALDQLIARSTDDQERSTMERIKSLAGSLSFTALQTLVATAASGAARHL